MGQLTDPVPVAGPGGVVHLGIQPRRIFLKGRLHRAGCLQKRAQVGGGQQPQPGKDPLQHRRQSLGLRFLFQCRTSFGQPLAQRALQGRNEQGQLFLGQALHGLHTRQKPGQFFRLRFRSLPDKGAGKALNVQKALRRSQSPSPPQIGRTLQPLSPGQISVVQQPFRRPRQPLPVLTGNPLPDPLHLIQGSDDLSRRAPACFVPRGPQSPRRLSPQFHPIHADSPFFIRSLSFPAVNCFIQKSHDVEISIAFHWEIIDNKDNHS